MGSAVQRLDLRTEPLEIRRASYAVMALVLASMASLAASFYLGGTARIASHVNLPAETTHGATVSLRLSAIFAVSAGILAMTQGGTFTRVPYAGSIVLLAALIIGTDKFLWHGVPWSVVSPTMTGTAVLLTFPAAWRLATDRQIVLAMSPLIGLCGLSVATYELQHNYFFSWYNRWGLVAVLIAAAAIVLTELPAWVRLALASVSVLSVMMSSSRQALLGMLLLAAVWLLRSKGVGSKLRGFAGAAIAIGVTYGAISASQRIEGVGGITASDGRGELLHSAWAVLSRSPLYGLAGDKPSQNLTSSLTSVGLGWSTSVHNFVLDAWLRGGLAAAVTATVLMIAITWPRRARGRQIGVGLLPFFMLGSELLYFGDTGASLVIALAYGIGMSGHRAARRPKRDGRVEARFHGRSRDARSPPVGVNLSALPARPSVRPTLWGMR